MADFNDALEGADRPGTGSQLPDPPPAHSAPPREEASSPPASQPLRVPPAARRVGKTRNPWGVWLLSLVTLGIYALYWYYMINLELREYDDQIEVQPGISLLACFFVITTLVSFVRTGGRILVAQRSANSTFRCSGVVGLALLIIGFVVVYYQSQINKVWDQYGNPEPGTPIAA